MMSVNKSSAFERHLLKGNSKKCFRNLVKGRLTVTPEAAIGLIVNIVGFLKIQPFPDALTQAKPNAHIAQIRLYEAFNFAEVSQVTLFAVGYVRDMAMPYRVAMLVGFFFDPDLDDKRVRAKFDRPISTPLLRALRCQTARF